MIDAAPSSVMRVVVTVFSDVRRTLEIYVQLKPDFMQLHGLPVSNEEGEGY